MGKKTVGRYVQCGVPVTGQQEIGRKWDREQQEGHLHNVVVVEQAGVAIPKVRDCNPLILGLSNVNGFLGVYSQTLTWRMYCLVLTGSFPNFYFRISYR